MHWWWILIKKWTSLLFCFDVISTVRIEPNIIFFLHFSLFNTSFILLEWTKHTAIWLDILFFFLSCLRFMTYRPVPFEEALDQFESEKKTIIKMKWKTNVNYIAPFPVGWKTIAVKTSFFNKRIYGSLWFVVVHLNALQRY